MKKIMGLLLPILLMTGMAVASDATIVVIDNKLVEVDKIVSPAVALTGAEQPTPPGEIVIIQANVSDEYPTFVKNRSFIWTVTEGGYTKRFWVDNDKVIFGAGIKATNINVEVKASFTYTVGTKDVVLVKNSKVNVVVGNPSPPPTPPTPPTPIPPTPPIPVPVLTGAAKFAFDTAIAVGPTDKASAKALSTGFRDMAAQIGHNPDLNDPKVLLARTKELNNSYLTNANIDPTVWDRWGQALQEYLWAQYQGGNLKTVDNYRVVWEDIYKGLSSVPVN